MPADNTPTVSVLVPVYNTERYLSQCMDALCSQSLHDLEIIAINDGSTDSSLEILKGYAERDTRIRIIDKPNSGYGGNAFPCLSPLLETACITCSWNTYLYLPSQQ